MSVQTSEMWALVSRVVGDPAVELSASLSQAPPLSPDAGWHLTDALGVKSKGARRAFPGLRERLKLAWTSMCDVEMSVLRESRLDRLSALKAAGSPPAEVRSAVLRRLRVAEKDLYTYRSFLQGELIEPACHASAESLAVWCFRQLRDAFSHLAEIDVEGATRVVQDELRRRSRDRLPLPDAEVAAALRAYLEQNCLLPSPAREIHETRELLNLYWSSHSGRSGAKPRAARKTAIPGQPLSDPHVSEVDAAGTQGDPLAALARLPDRLAELVADVERRHRSATRRADEAERALTGASDRVGGLEQELRAASEERDSAVKQAAEAKERLAAASRRIAEFETNLTAAEAARGRAESELAATQGQLRVHQASAREVSENARLEGIAAVLRTVGAKYSLDDLNEVATSGTARFSLQAFLNTLLRAVEECGLRTFPKGREGEEIRIGYEDMARYAVENFTLTPGSSVLVRLVRHGWGFQGKNRIIPVEPARVRLAEPRTEATPP